ncbi:NaeI family type II restriction endonuclease [Streptomyces sp. NPDC004041]|uniref:NaeI family type II restriction endonuclease n=1 Tax=Streptomyces sp. NPDC004041 TaxID=3364688 RepID=UPI00367D5FE7
MRSIVVLLREAIDENGIGLRGLAQKIRTEHPHGPLPYGYQTLSKRLRGIGLQNEPHLIHAVIAICVEEGRRADVTAQVTELLADARGAAATSASAPSKQSAATDRQLLDALAELNTLRKKMERLRNRAERAEKKLAKAHELLATRAHPEPPPPRTSSPSRTAGKPDSRPSRPAQQPPAATPTKTTTPHHNDGPGLEEVTAFLSQVPDLQQRTASSLRAAFDSVLDGERTGRYDLASLGRIEKAYLSNRVAHFLWRAWGLIGHGADRGMRQVPLCFTWTPTWVLGPEKVGRVCLLMRVDESESRWSLGVLDVASEHLNNRTSNRDGKKTLSAAGKAAIRWLVKDAALPENTLLNLDPATLSQVLAPAENASARHSQRRINNLFRLVQGRLIDRGAVSAVAMTHDSAKRVRQARGDLLSEGILILGPYESQRRVAAALGLPQPEPGQWISIRVARRRPGEDEGPFAEINAEQWRVAAPEDPAEAAPAVR